VKYRARYFDGTTPTAHEVEVEVNNMVLEITKNHEVVDHWPLKLLYRDDAHFTKVVIACEGEDDARLELEDTRLLNEFAPKKPLSAKNNVKFTPKQVALWSVGVIVAISILFLMIKPVTKFIAKRVSHETERTLLTQMERIKPATCALNMEQSFALENLLSKIYPQSEEDKSLGLRVQILDSAQVNAFALPGAQIWVMKGLLKEAKTPEELAGILAHEVEHVKQRHVLESLVRGALFTSLLSLAVGDASGVFLVDPHTAMSIISLNFDREMESSADEGALRRLEAANVSSQGMADFFERNKEKFGSKIPGFLSTHPADAERMKKFSVNKEKEKSFSSVLSEKEWQILKTACD
jgi:Zn-dependent protease with chaperone function